jgi:hypothetical protein
MTKNEFVKACEKVGCTVSEGRVMLGDIQLGYCWNDSFDIVADPKIFNLRATWKYTQVDLNTFKVLLKDVVDGIKKSKEVKDASRN